MKHTALPWTGDEELHTGLGTMIPLIAKAGDTPIGFIHSWTDAGKANAEFIVKACNNHYKLVEACKNIMETDPDNFNTDLLAIGEMKEIAGQALAEEEG